MTWTWQENHELRKTASALIDGDGPEFVLGLFLRAPVADIMPAVGPVGPQAVLEAARKLASGSEQAKRLDRFSAELATADARVSALEAKRSAANQARQKIIDEALPGFGETLAQATAKIQATDAELLAAREAREQLATGLEQCRRAAAEAAEQSFQTARKATGDALKNRVESALAAILKKADQAELIALAVSLLAMRELPQSLAPAAILPQLGAGKLRLHAPEAA